MGDARWEGKWLGGRTYRDRAGQVVYFIEKMVLGNRYRVPVRGLEGLSGRVLEEELAFQLKTFMRDPEAYKRAVGAKPKPTEESKGGVFLNEAMILRCVKDLKDADCAPGYRSSVASYLSEWETLLNGRDLTTIEPSELVEMEDRSGRSKRLMRAALKTYTAFCREKLLTLRLKDDPTAELPTLRAGKAKLTQRMALTVEEAEKVYAELSEFPSKTKSGEKQPQRYLSSTAQAVRDQVLVHLKTGMHETELLRIIRGERGAKVRGLADQGAIAGTLFFQHKSGLDHVQSVDAQTLAAVQRLVKLGSLAGESFMRRMLEKASTAAGLESPLTVRRCRHTFETVAEQLGVEIHPKAGPGVPMEVVSRTMGHQNLATTRIYQGDRVPSLIKLPFNLKHRDDPPSEGADLGEQRALPVSRKGLHRATGRRNFRNPPRGNRKT